MNLRTKAVVRVVLEIDAGSDGWNEDEPGLARAFRYAKEHALNVLNRVFQGKGLKGELAKVRVVEVQRVDITVSDGKARESEGA